MKRDFKSEKIIGNNLRLRFKTIISKIEDIIGTERNIKTTLIASILVLIVIPKFLKNISLKSKAEKKITAKARITGDAQIFCRLKSIS